MRTIHIVTAALVLLTTPLAASAPGPGAEGSGSQTAFQASSAPLDPRADLVATTHEAAAGDQTPLEGTVGAWLAGTDGGPSPDAARLDVEASEALLQAVDARERLATASGDGLASAIAMAKVGTDHQRALLGLTGSSPEIQTFDRPSRSIQALLASEDRTISPSEEESLTRLDELPGDQAKALADVVDAYRAFRLATDDARDQGAFSASSADADPVDRSDAGLGSVLAARSDLLSAVERLQEASAGQPASSPVDVDECPVVVIDGEGDDVYREDCGLIVDLGGDDTYLNNAGGADGDAAALVDLGGDDRYGTQAETRSGGYNGGAQLGAGLLVDASGDDRYAAWSEGVNGGANARGAGLLVDGTGNDTYRAGVDETVQTLGSVGSHGVNGGADVNSLGLLVDGEGQDAYQAAVGVTCNLRCVPIGSYGVNGGGHDGGVGTILDGGGSDLYQAGVDLECPGSCEEIGSHGVNAGGNFGHGLLWDAFGFDQYQAGVGMACQDCYLVGSQGTNGGGVTHAVTVLLDDGPGDDTYQTGVDVECDDLCSPGKGAVNGGSAAGTSLLADALGDNLYQAGVGVSMSCVDTDCDTEVGSHGVNGGAESIGRSMLLDGAGDDVYEAGVDSVCPKEDACEVGEGSVNGGGELSVGLLVDGGGTDEYRDHQGGTGTDVTVVPKGTVGAQIDSDDPTGPAP